MIQIYELDNSVIVQQANPIAPKEMGNSKDDGHYQKTPQKITSSKNQTQPHFPFENP